MKSAEFETTWGTVNNANPMADGELSLEVVWDGYDIPFSSTGVTVGIDEATPILMMGGMIDGDNGAMILPYIVLDLDVIDEGETIIWDDDTVIGGAYYTEDSYWGEWVFLGYLVGGSMTFDFFDTEMGGNVKGVLSTSIYIWEPYE